MSRTLFPCLFRGGWDTHVFADHTPFSLPSRVDQHCALEHDFNTLELPCLQKLIRLT